MSQPDLFSQSDLSNEKFMAFHEANPHVYQKFKELAFEAINAGRKNFSIDMIWGAMRWYSSIQTTDETYRLNNNYRASYGRLFVKEFPEHKDFFRFRDSKSNAILRAA